MRKVFSLFITIFSCTAALAQFNGTSYEDLYDSETVSSFKSHIRYLSAAALEGRGSGTEGEKMAADYFRNALLGYGVDVLSPEGGDLFGIRTESGDTLTSRNVVGFIQGSDKSLSGNYIVIGARLDNLGIHSYTIDGQPASKIFYGAVGNASGVAMLLELARMLKTNEMLLRRSVLIIGFGASQETFAGAWYFLNRGFSDVSRIDAMINLDMLGLGTTGFYAYTSSNPDMNTLLRMQEGELLPVHPQIAGAEIYPSDHRAFYAKEIPSVMFSNGRYPEHNTEKDTQSLIDYTMMERELEYIYSFSLSLSNTNIDLAFRPDEKFSEKKNSQEEGVIPYYECDIKPMFLNSDDPRQFMEKWVYQYLKYPYSAVKDGIQGRVMVEFIIGKDGKVRNARVVRGVSEELDAEALKVVAASPKWKPGRVNGQKVNCSMTVPVEFRLEKRGKPSFGFKRHSN